MKKVKIKELIEDIDKKLPIEDLQKKAELVDMESIKKEGLKTAIFLINAVKKSNLNAINIHKEKIKSQIRAVANDNPFEINEIVAVTRFEHAWVDGRMEAKILNRTQNDKGIWSYNAEIISENMKGCNIQINHTRDAVSIQKPKKIKRNIR